MSNYVRGPISPQAIEQAHHCPVPWCATLCSPGHVSCRFHWRRVPQDLRDPLIFAFRQRETDPIGFVRACDEGRTLVQRYAMAPMTPRPRA